VVDGKLRFFKGSDLFGGLRPLRYRDGDRWRGGCDVGKAEDSRTDDDDAGIVHKLEEARDDLRDVRQVHGNGSKNRGFAVDFIKYMQSYRQANFLEGVNLKYQRLDLVVGYYRIKVLRIDFSFLSLTLAHPHQKLDEVIHDLDPAMGPRGLQ